MVKMKKNKKGNSGMVASVVMLITVVVLLMISMLVVAKVRGSVAGTLENTSANRTTGAGEVYEQDTFDEIKSGNNTAFSLMAIALIVLVAFIIISILRGGA